MIRKQITPGTGLRFMLSTAERDLIVERRFIDPEMATRLRDAQTSGTKVQVALTLDDVDDLAGHIAVEANHCKDRHVRRTLDAVHDRLARLEAEYTDEDPAPEATIKPEKVESGTIHPEAGPIPLVHLLLHQGPPTATGGGGPAGVLSIELIRQWCAREGIDFEQLR